MTNDGGQCPRAETGGGTVGVFLFDVNVLGTKSRCDRWCPDMSQVGAMYERYDREKNGNRSHPAERVAIHAVRDDSGTVWPRHLPCVENDGYVGPDRSCNPERCDCQALGLPIKTHPYRI